MAKISPLANIRLAPQPCVYKTSLYIVNPSQLAYGINTHASCYCNEVVSLYNRHLVDRTTIGMDNALWRKISKLTLRKYYPKFIQPLTYQQVIARYTGAKKKAYFKAKQILTTEGLQKKHSVIKMFVKPDRHPLSEVDEKDPRAIQYRHPCFTLGFMTYIAAFEEVIYPSVDYGCISGSRVIAKGLNPEQRAALLLDKISHFNTPVYVLLDHSRFDSCITVEHLKSTHRKYQRAFGRGIRKYTRCQLNNTGYSKHDIKYRIKGTRMSGDADTGCGNSIVNADTLWGVCYINGITKFDFILDGDDSVLILERSDAKKLNTDQFKLFGFNTKMQVVDNIFDIEFCQSKIIFTNPPKFVRYPWRTLSHSYACRNRYPAKMYRHWMAAVGECELAMNSGVPILQEYGLQLSRLSPRKFYDAETKWRMQLPTRYQPVTNEARISFYLAFGVDVGLQRLLEQVDFTANMYSLVQGGYFAHKAVQYDESIQRARGIYESLPPCSSSCWCWSS